MIGTGEPDAIKLFQIVAQQITAESDIIDAVLRERNRK
jgi:hypothetical protein